MTKEKRENKTPEELKAELRQKALKKFLEEIEEVSVKHQMRLMPTLQADNHSIQAVFSVEDMDKVEYKKADEKSETDNSTDTNDKGA